MLSFQSEARTIRLETFTESNWNGTGLMGTFVTDKLTAVVIACVLSSEAQAAQANMTQRRTGARWHLVQRIPSCLRLSLL